ncbi:MAG: HIT domain-containing protein [Chloroflexi bacterium]|nr:HIT domain-containing protein [Chloroflexota bacterium]
MDRLYTPWRLSYVVNEKPSHCPFCQYIRQDPAHDPENYLLFRGERAFIILNRFPYNSGHLMVLPNEHIASLLDLEPQVRNELMELTTYSIHLLTEAYHPQGFNVGLNLGQAAGAGMAAHLHFHIVPRWQGDTNFMPIIGETKVLPELLEDTYKRLRQVIAKQP